MDKRRALKTRSLHPLLILSATQLNRNTCLHALTIMIKQGLRQYKTAVTAEFLRPSFVADEGKGRQAGHFSRTTKNPRPGELPEVSVVESCLPDLYCGSKCREDARTPTAARKTKAPSRKLGFFRRQDTSLPTRLLRWTNGKLANPGLKLLERGSGQTRTSKTGACRHAQS